MAERAGQQGYLPRARGRRRDLALGVAIAFLLTLPAGASTARHILAEAFTATW